MRHLEIGFLISFSNNCGCGTHHSLYDSSFIKCSSSMSPKDFMQYFGSVS
jgi:hypothetical protein